MLRVVCLLVTLPCAAAGPHRRAVELSGGAAAAPTTAEQLTLPDGVEWKDYCERLDRWEPDAAKAPAPPPCTSNRDATSCKAERNCIWHGKDCVLSTLCEQRIDKEGCLGLSECYWDGARHLCAHTTCSSKATGKLCIEARHSMGCMWDWSAETCVSCPEMRRASLCPPKLCEWHEKATAHACRRHPEVYSAVCDGDEIRCAAVPGCAWNTTSAACEKSFPDCNLNNETACEARDACQWHTGDCKAPQRLVCSNLTTQETCEVEKMTCAWYTAPRCEAPWCIGFDNRPNDCNLLNPGCKYEVETGKCLVDVRCSSRTDEKDCGSGPGCTWKQIGCHEHDSACFGKEQHLCVSIQGCKWEEQGACEHTECEGLNVSQCADKSTCIWDSHQAKCQATGTNKVSHGHSESPPYNILVIFAIGMLGAFARHNFRESRLPYTVILFMIGAVFDGLAQIDQLSYLKNFVELQDIDPHLMFYIFLPVLIFESAFAVDWFVFRTVLGHALILAGPGIVTATALTGLVAKYVFDYQWTWVMSLLFGVTLSATDPVAVVALLKELGASPQISTLIEGESLLNDGTAIVFFNILSAAVAGCSGEIEDEWWELLIELVKVAGGGPLLGYVCGVTAVFCLSKVFNDPLIEITTSLVTAYVTFFIAEAYAKVSGVLALVVCGVYVSHRRQCISPEVHHTLHEFWEMAVYLGNTLIFAIAGMIVAGKAFAHVTFKDFIFLLVTYFAINVIRLINLKFFAVLYNRFEYKLEGGNMALVCWGGLRGAVGLALALIVAGDHRLHMRNEDDPRTILQNKLVFFVAMIVVLTLLVNGVTTQDLVRHFKLDQVSETKKRMMKENFKRLKRSGRDQLNDLKTEGALYDVNWLEAQGWVFDNMQDPYNKPDEFLGEGDPHAEAIMHYYKILHSSVWEQNEEGLLDGDAVRFLLAKIDEGEKAAKKKEAEQMEAMHALVDTTDAGALAKAAASAEDEEMDPKMPFPGATEVAVVYTAGGRTLTAYFEADVPALKVKEFVYREENIPVVQQRVFFNAKELTNGEDLRSQTDAKEGGKLELLLEQRNPDEDVLMTADILQEFWDFEEGWYGHWERLEDRIYRLGRNSFLEKKWTFGFNVAMALVIAHDAILAQVDNRADPAEANKLKTHAKKVKREVLTQLVQIAKIASKTSTAMKTTLAARTVLNHARSKVWDWQKDGLIEEPEAAVLVNLVEQKMKELTGADNKMPPCNPDYILSMTEWYQKASSDARELLRSRRKIERFRRGEVLIKKGEEHNQVMLITAGSARVHVNRRFDYVGPGYVAGLLGALTSTTKFCDVYAETDMTVLTFKADAIANMMHKKGNEDFYMSLWKCAGADLAYKLFRGNVPYSAWAPREVRKFVNRGRLLELPKYRNEDKKILLGHGCYHVLVSGTAKDATNAPKDASIDDLEVYDAPCLLPQDCHEVYLYTKKWKLEADSSAQWFAAQDDAWRADKVQLLIVEDPRSASARARKYWDKIYEKIRSIKTTAALRKADVATALAEAFEAAQPPAARLNSGSGVSRLPSGGQVRAEAGLEVPLLDPIDLGAKRRK